MNVRIKHDKFYEISIDGQKLDWKTMHDIAVYSRACELGDYLRGTYQDKNFTDRQLLAMAYQILDDIPYDDDYHKVEDYHIEMAINDVDECVNEYKDLLDSV